MNKIFAKKEKSNIKAKAYLSQNFLIDKQIIERIIKTIYPKKNDNVAEIGPGLGALSSELLMHLDQLHAIEIDKELVAHLKKNHPLNLKLYCEDVLKFNFYNLPTPLRIVGNLPYHIASQILFKIQKYHTHIKDIHFMLQKEVVDRIVATKGGKIYGRLSIMMQLYFEIAFLFKVPNYAFYPQPQVDSAMIYLKPKALKNDINIALFEQIVKTAFSTRRKILKNCLKLLIKPEATSIDLTQRAESLSLSDFITLTRDVVQAKNIKENNLNIK